MKWAGVNLGKSTTAVHDSLKTYSLATARQPHAQGTASGDQRWMICNR